MHRFSPDMKGDSEVSLPVAEVKVSKPSASTFGIRSRLLGSKKELLKPKSGLKNVLRTDYHLALFTAVIKALQCEVVEIARESSALACVSEEYRYVRDPVVVFHDKKLMISCKGNEEFGSREILQQFDGYKHIVVDNAYFEGGNMFYSPCLNRVFHGMQPGGYYAKAGGLVLSEMAPENYYKVIPDDTNKSLQEQLHPYGIAIEGLELNPVVINHVGYFGKRTSEAYYYHLDCFMQLLPDGRLIILNKEILSEASSTKLENLFGDKFIDLAYAEYLTNPVIFNCIFIYREDNLFLVAPSLPKSVRTGLAQHHLTVITPETLTFGSEYYEENYARKVAEIMQGAGYEKAKGNNLATKLAKYKHGYKCFNDKVLTHLELKSMKMHLSDSYKFHPISFVVDGGGPHCLTTEIVPSLPKVSDNESTLFNQHRDTPQPLVHYNFASMRF